MKENTTTTDSKDFMLLGQTYSKNMFKGDKKKPHKQLKIEGITI